MPSEVTVRGRGPGASQTIADVRNRKFSWSQAIGELIDNAVGNGAANVRIRFTPHHVEIVDDGVGCDAEKLAAMVSFGWHLEDDRVNNPVSRFGMGAKHAFVWAGGPTHIYSKRDGEYRAYHVDWDDFGAEWNYPDPITGAAAQTICKDKLIGDSGVNITIPNHDRRMDERTFESLFRKLSQTHWAAVETGVAIDVRYRCKGTSKWMGGALAGKPLPDFIEGQSIDKRTTLSDGRVIRIVGGVLAPHVRITDPGYEYIFGHRIVITCGATGAGGMDYERVYFRVFMEGDKDGWQVTTNKTGLHDADEAALAEVVFMHTEAMLSRSGDEDYERMRDDELCDEIGNDMSNANRKKAKRGQRTGENQGTRTPTGRGGRHQHAQATQDAEGNCESPSKKQNGVIRVRAIPFADSDAHMIGKANVKDKVVRLNKLHPFVASAFRERDKRSLTNVAYAIWSSEWIKFDDNNNGLMVHRGTFVDKFSAMLKEFPQYATTDEE